MIELEERALEEWAELGTLCEGGRPYRLPIISTGNDRLYDIPERKYNRRN